MTDAPQILLHHHLKKLRLPTFQGEYAKQAQLCAAENKDHIQYLARLCEMELIDRERRMIERRIKATKFPSTKSLDSFDFKIMPSLNKPLTMELARCVLRRSSPKHHRTRAVRHGQDTHCIGTWIGGMPKRAEGALYNGGGLGS